MRLSFQAQDFGTSCSTTGECVAMIATPLRLISKSDNARTNAESNGG